MLTSAETTVDELGFEISSETLIQSQNISLHIGGKELLSEISLNISKSEIVTVIGPNGAGKSCLLIAVPDVQPQALHLIQVNEMV